MIAKEKLLEEIFKKTNYDDNFWFTKFIDANIQKIFSKFLNEKDKYMNLLYEIIYISWQVIILYAFHSFLPPFTSQISKIVMLVLLLINIVVLLVLLKMKNGPYKNYLMNTWVKII